MTYLYEVLTSADSWALGMKIGSIRQGIQYDGVTYVTSLITVMYKLYITVLRLVT